MTRSIGQVALNPYSSPVRIQSYEGARFVGAEWGEGDKIHLLVEQDPTAHPCFRTVHLLAGKWAAVPGGCKYVTTVRRRELQVMDNSIGMRISVFPVVAHLEPVHIYASVEEIPSTQGVSK